MMKKTIILGLLLFMYCSQLFSQPYEKTPWGIKTIIESTNIEVQFYTPQIVRVIKFPAGETKSCQKQSLSVIKEPERTTLDITQESNILILKSEYLRALLNLTTGSVSFTGLDWRPLFSEKEYSSSFMPVMDAGDKTYKVCQTFLLDKQEAIYGLGQQQEGRMNQRNQRVVLSQENMRICIPFIQSVKGYGLFWDNYSTTIFTDNLQGMSFDSEVGDCIDYYFMFGGNADKVISCMRDLTGQSPLFPLWTWGYWQSRERYVSREEIVGVVQKYRDLKVPLDGIIQDWQYWGTDNAYWNAMEFGNPAFPQPEKMMEDIHKLHAHAIISVWPSFGTKTKPYKELKEKGLLFRFENFPVQDSVRVYKAFTPQARDIYWKFVNQNIFSTGMDGWWLDATEPEHDHKKKADFDEQTGLGTFRRVHNAFPLMTVGGVYEHQRSVTNDKRVFILTRSAFAGQQRYAACSWSGDVDGNWETLRKQIIAGLNFSLCGIPYWNTDIGGFFVRDGGSSAYADYRELYVRWLQFGAFCPMMRSHGTNTPREIWHFGQRGDWAYDAIEKYINLRYKLLPYNYALSWNVANNAGSIIRALSMDFSKDKNVHEMGSEYMYGSSFLVVPVTTPFYATGKGSESTVDFSKTQTQKVYLPKGADWYDFWTNEKLQGGQTIEKETPIDVMPLYVKAGSIVPCIPTVPQYATEKDWSNLELKIYDGADAEFTLYEDEGDNYNYEKKMYSTIPIKWDNAGRILTIEDRQGEFPGMLKKREFKVILGNTTNIIVYQGKTVKQKIEK